MSGSLASSDAQLPTCFQAGTKDLKDPHGDTMALSSQGERLLDGRLLSESQCPLTSSRLQDGSVMNEVNLNQINLKPRIQ